MAEREKIATLMKLSLDELYIQIGAEYIGLGAMPRSLKDLAQIGKLWLESKKSELIEILCNNEQLNSLLKSEPKRLKDRIVLVAAVADLLSSIITGVSPITVSVLLIKAGLEDLCENTHKSS